MIFNNNEDLRKFARTLAQKMEAIDETVLADELKNWDGEFFTTSSEFLGELKIILEKIKALKTIDDAIMRDVKECITSINKAFGV